MAQFLFLCHTNPNFYKFLVMCGIVAYVGQQDALPIILKGLKRLEYRGYDSAGVALLDQRGLSIYKKKGKVAELEKFQVQSIVDH